ncbi:hypothetical protein DPSP01_001788 [Paraphaeosphaeria sporulosa]
MLQDFYVNRHETEATEALQLLYHDAEHPRFKDSWARALTYLDRPLEEATPTNRADDTIQEVILQAEAWVDALYEAICNVENVRNKATSIELAMFKSPLLDKKAVEAACRSTLLDKRICKDVLTEDSKVFQLVHAPFALLKIKKSQEKGNDVKRNLLAAASALEPTPALPASAATASPCSLSGGLSVLSSQGFATLNEERSSNKRSRGDLTDGSVNGGKRARTKGDTS